MHLLLCDAFLLRRRYASTGISCRVSVCLIKTTKLRMTQTVPHDSPGNLVFWH